MQNLTIKKNISIGGKALLSFAVLAGILVAVNFFGGFKIVEASSCPTDTASLDRDGRFSYNIVIDPGHTTASVVIHNSSNCSIPMTLVSWKVYNNDLGDQSIFAEVQRMTNPNGDTTIVVPLASCTTQVDLYYGSNRNMETDYAMYWANGCSHTPPPPPVCTTNCNPPPATLTGSCSVNPSSANIGDVVSWSSSASGGTGSYTYSWSGTDGLSGNSSSVSKSYSNAGNKLGTVTINSGSQTIVRNCNTNITQNIVNDLTISCTANPSRVDVDEDVIWRAYPAGGNGSYTYDWDGTDDLNGSSRYLTWSYDDDGTKQATVTVISDGQTASASCTVRVDDEENDDDDLSVSCYASPSNPQINSRMRWYVDVDGGDGDYDYDWNGTDGLNSSSRSPYMTYDTPGSKRATVTVTDGDGNEESDTCTVNLGAVLAYSQTYQPPVASAVYLSQVPYTGLADDYKVSLFVITLALFSAWIAYIIIARKKEVGELN